jgi:hypothetical protein
VEDLEHERRENFAYFAPFREVRGPNSLSYVFGKGLLAETIIRLNSTGQISSMLLHNKSIFWRTRLQRGLEKSRPLVQALEEIGSCYDATPARQR